VIRVTRRYRFSASHRLHAPQLGDGENRRIYGKCNNPFGHGHNYEVEVSARGPLDPQSGLAIDRARLDRLVRREVLDAFAHRDLNACGAFREAPPTSENLGIEIMRRLKRNWASEFQGAWPRLEGVRIAETARNIFQVSADEIE
jgi:6-pyruvoyltetrahydropterin/6-carboxytetrahydropterin synthase